MAPDYGISVVNVYRTANAALKSKCRGLSGGVSPASAPADYRASEAVYAEAWFRTITNEIWG